MITTPRKGQRGGQSDAATGPDDENDSPARVRNGHGVSTTLMHPSCLARNIS